MPEGIVRGVSRTHDGALNVEMAPGFELLGTYIESDIAGLDGGPHQAVREVLERAARDGSTDDVVSDAFALEADGDEVTLTHIWRENVTATYGTLDVLIALDEYARLRKRWHAG